MALKSSILQVSKNQSYIIINVIERIVTNIANNNEYIFIKNDKLCKKMMICKKILLKKYYKFVFSSLKFKLIDN